MATLDPKLNFNIEYKRRRPENSLLYKTIQENLGEFLQTFEYEHNYSLPGFVKKEFKDYLKCGILAHGFLRVRCQECANETLVAFSCKRRGFCSSCGTSRMVERAAHLMAEVLPVKPYRQWVLSFPFELRFLLAKDSKVMDKVLSIVNRALSTFILRKCGLTKKSGAKSGAITFIQRFGGSLNLNPHLHILSLDGAYSFEGDKKRFHVISQPTSKELDKLLKAIVSRIVKYLEKQGHLERMVNGEAYLPGINDGFEWAQANSIKYRLAFGKNKGQRPFHMKMLPAKAKKQQSPFLAKNSGFSLHAGVSCKAGDRKKLERLCQYVGRSSLSEQRLSKTPYGDLIYLLKTPYDDGTSHIVLSPLEFLGRLASIVPKPRVNLVRFYGVFAPNSNRRKQIVPTRRKVVQAPSVKSCTTKTYRLSWAEKLKRVFKLDISVCARCRGDVKIVSSIESPVVICKILNHLGLSSEPPKLTSPRGPPAGDICSDGFEAQYHPDYE